MSLIHSHLTTLEQTALGLSRSYANDAQRTGSRAFLGDTSGQLMRSYLLGERSPDASHLIASTLTLPETTGRVLTTAPAGFLPHVPAHLAGHPDTMHAFTDAPTTSAPLTIFCELSTSGGIEAPEVSRMLDSFACLYLLAAATRPTRLIGFCEVRADSHTAPTSLISATLADYGRALTASDCAIWADPRYVRGFLYAWTQQIANAPAGTVLRWGRSGFPNEKNKLHPDTIAALGATPRDLIFRGQYLTGMASPAEWAASIFTTALAADLCAA